MPVPLALVGARDTDSLTRRADQLQRHGFRVALARTPFETIVKASCQLPDLILLDSSFGPDAADETAELLTTCPATAHIPIVRLSAGRRMPSRVYALTRC
jgi:CheY-like chemotaxis protein